jgi:hypothetical protein
MHGQGDHHLSGCCCVMLFQDEGLRFLCSKAEIIDELESTLPSWIKAPRWYPKFIHILKFHPDSTYEVLLPVLLPVLLLHA